MLQFWGSDGTVCVIIFGTDGSMLKVDSSFTLNTGEWYYVTATWDLEKVTLYINGFEDNSSLNTVGEVRVSDGGLVIGAQLTEPLGSYSHVGFDGFIDEVEILERVLTPEEVQDRFDAVMGQ